MRWFFIILIFPCFIIRAQVVDDFFDGNFSNNPQWIGTTDNFRVDASTGMLQLFGPAADDEAWLFTPSQAIENATWQFRVKMGFNPSSANYAKVYLTAESAEYPNVGSSFFLVLGTSADNICLWERRNGIETKLIEGTAGRLNVSNVDVKVRVTRLADGLFILESNMGGDWFEEGRKEGTIGMESSWFGISCHYTSTRSTLFYFDDFEVTGDSLPPTLLNDLAARNDLVITEVMSDPSPMVKLPDSEYIEIYNRSEFPVQLNGYNLSVGTRESILGAYMLYPNEYLLLVPSTQIDEWTFVSNRLGVTSWPLLSNTGGEIVLRDQSGKVIASLKYGQNLGSSGFKQDGGWSLEVKDPDNLSGDIANWTFSVNDSGGTPGLLNSVAASFPDFNLPLLNGIYIDSSACVVMEFSEPIRFADGMDSGQIELDPPTLSLASIQTEEVFMMKTKLCFSEEMPENKVYDLLFKILPVDLADNALSGRSSFSFGLPIKPAIGDVLINELLFDPVTDGYDYLELYNNSDKLLDLSEVYVARANSDGVPEKLIKVAPEKRVFLPQSYLALTANADWLLLNYQMDDPWGVKNIFDLPNFPSGLGTVFVTNESGLTYDRFDYDENMHFDLLASNKGVALERIDVNVSAQEGSNWHSASATSGYGTPGKLNSQAKQNGLPFDDDFIKIEPEVFYPNQDGIDDLLMIRYSFFEEGNSCTITIFTHDGRPVRHLINNQLAGVEGFFTWNGLSDSGDRCPSGIYIVWARSFAVGGSVRETRKVAVLGAGNP